MFTTVASLIAAGVAGAAGHAFVWPHVSSLVASWKASRAVTNAKALIAAAEANVAALEAAKKVVAAAPVATPTGTTGPTGA